ncbi:MAG: hypothetical protein K9H41_02765 [Bacteroidia bacterium]|nr:hypothetical protein [Bacteroidia bacterium]
MNRQTFSGAILKKSFSNDDFVLIKDELTSRCYYFYRLGVDRDFPVGTNVQYTLVTFSDNNPPIVIDMQ